MVPCISAGKHGEDGVLVDVLGCVSCHALWCRQCEPASLVCPKCGSENVEFLTLGDDAYL